MNQMISKVTNMKKIRLINVLTDIVSFDVIAKKN